MPVYGGTTVRTAFIRPLRDDSIFSLDKLPDYRRTKPTPTTRVSWLTVVLNVFGVLCALSLVAVVGLLTYDHIYRGGNTVSSFVEDWKVLIHNNTWWSAGRDFALGAPEAAGTSQPATATPATPAATPAATATPTAHVSEPQTVTQVVDPVTTSQVLPATAAPAATATSPAAVAAPTATAPAAVVPKYLMDTPTIQKLRDAAKLMDAELMKFIPESFDPALKNPCWSDTSDPAANPKRTRCLPYFYVAGSFHGGGQSLSQKIHAHPNVITDAGSNDQFWAEDGKKMGRHLDHFASATERVLKEPTTSVIMDSSLSTFPFYWSAGMKAHRAFVKSSSACWQACNDAAGKGGPKLAECAPRCLQEAFVEDKKVASAAGIPYEDQHVPLLVAAVYGARLPKFIVLVRDPVTRLHSAYWGYPHYNNHYGKTAEGFLKYVKEQLGAFRQCMSEGHTDIECALYFEALGWEQEKVFFHCDQVMRGMYSVFLDIWLRYIPLDHFMVIKSEEFFADSKRQIVKVVKFLGLPEANAELLTTMDAAGTPISHVKGQPEMLPEARQLLADFYRPYNVKLAELTGNTAFLAWNT